MSLAGAAAMQSLMGTKFLHMLGNADIVERLFKPALRGEKIGAICMTEPNAGSDLDGIATPAKQVDGRLRAQRPEDLDHRRRRSPTSSPSSPRPATSRS